MSPFVRSIPSFSLAVASLASMLLPVGCPAAERTPDATTHPIGGGGAVILERIPDKPAAVPRQRIVYTCVSPGLTTFSDRPCGPVPERREIELLPAAAGRSGEAASVAPPQVRASTKPAAVPRKDDARTPRVADRQPGCQQLRQAVAAIDRQMRAGYSAREAPRLWERWREAKDRLHAARCS